MNISAVERENMSSPEMSPRDPIAANTRSPRLLATTDGLSVPTVLLFPGMSHQGDDTGRGCLAPLTQRMRSDPACRPHRRFCCAVSCTAWAGAAAGSAHRWQPRGCFPGSEATGKVGADICSQVFVRYLFLFLLGWMGLTVSPPTFTKNRQTIFQNGCTILMTRFLNRKLLRQL